MAFGDIGGVLTELVITCKTPIPAREHRKGDAVKLAGPYTVTNDTSAGDSVFGEASPRAVNGAAIPVKVRRRVRLPIRRRDPPVVDGVAGVVAAATSGRSWPRHRQRNRHQPQGGHGRGPRPRLALRRNLHGISRRYREGAGRVLSMGTGYAPPDPRRGALRYPAESRPEPRPVLPRARHHRARLLRPGVRHRPRPHHRGPLLPV